MKKKIVFALLFVLLVAGLLGGIKFLQIRRMIDQGKGFVPPPEVVTTAVAILIDSAGGVIVEAPAAPS